MSIRKANVKIENSKVVFSQEILDYFESIRTEENSIWIDKYFEVLSDFSNFNAEKYNIHHIKPCFTFKDENHKTRKETKPLADEFNGNLIKLSVYNHLFIHYYLWKIFNNKDSKLAFQRMCGINKYTENITENELKEIAILKEECTKENLTEEEIIGLKRKYAKTHKEKAEYDKKYRENNKDRISKRKKQYREKNKDNIKKSLHEWYENNKEEHSKKAKIYREENKEKLAKHSKEYREQNKEKLKISKKTYASQECYDPIKENYCTLNALSLRKSRHLDLYKNIIPQNCIIQK